MILTQKEAAKWSEILKGFSEGKEYEIPMVYDNNGNVTQWIKITDFKVNSIPTITLMYQGLTKINPFMIREVKSSKINNEYFNPIPR